MSHIHRATSTFLFTDIEGSTRRWEESVEMVDQVDAHFEILRREVAAGGGEVFATMGDGIAAAFPSAGAALAAAVESQRQLRTLGLRVRMGLHTAEVERRDDDFRGRPLNRAARLMAAGHGGQVLLTDVAATLARSARAPTELVELGSFRLRDLAEPERVWQAVHPGLERSFPPLRGVHASGTGVPVERTSFVGRATELRRVGSLLEQHRLVTLTGVGGVGKTRLAVAAANVLPATPVVWFVDLAAVADAEDVAAAIACTLGAVPGSDAIEASATVLAGDRTVLVMDSCEHVVDAAADVIDVLTVACPDLTVLATSREGLGVDGEHIVVVPPLDPSTAVELFEQRAVAAGAALDHVDRADVEDLCRRLDGIPLAIELAAAHTATLGVTAIAGGLDDRAGPLAGRRRRTDGRHGTMRLAIDWSHRLLEPDERRLVRWLAMFPAGFELDAVSCIAAALGLDARDAADHLESLVHKSMVVAEHPDTGPRYRILEVVRAFLLERLDDAGERMGALRALADWVTTLTDLPYDHPCNATVERSAVRLEREVDAWREAASLARTSSDGALAAALCGPPTAFFLLGRNDLADAVRSLLPAVGQDPLGRRSVLAALIVAAAGNSDPVEVQAWVDEVAAAEEFAPSGLGGLMQWMALAWRGDFASSVEVCVRASRDEALAASTRDLFVGIAVLDHFSLTESSGDPHELLVRALDVADRSDVALTRVSCLLGAAWGLRDEDPGRSVQLVRRALDDVHHAPALTRFTLPGSASRLLAQLDPRVAARGLLDQLDSAPSRPAYLGLVPLLYGASVLERMGHPAADSAGAILAGTETTPFFSMMDVVDVARRSSSVISRAALVELTAVVRDALAGIASRDELTSCGPG